MADGDEHAVDRQLRALAGRWLRSTIADDLARSGVVHLLDFALFQMNAIFGLANALSCMIFDARSVSRRWIDRDLRGELRQEDRLLHRGVAAADDGDRLAAEEVAVARRAGRDTVADQLPSDGSPSSRAEAPVAMMSVRG